MRLLYLLAQHPLHLHRALVRRGLLLGWLDAVRPFVNAPGVKPVGLPVDDYASFQIVRYLMAARFREKHPSGEPWDHDYNPILSHLWRREMHPLRWLPAAWHLRHCETVLEFGCGAAPYAHGVTTAWPRRQKILAADLPGPFMAYGEWRFQHEPDVAVLSLPRDGTRYLLKVDGIVCTEVFEHVPDPVKIADWMTSHARIICFDYVMENTTESQLRRADTLNLFQARGRLRGPDKRGLYVWRRRDQ